MSLVGWYCYDCEEETICPEKSEYFDDKGRIIQCLLCSTCGTALQSNIKTDDEVK